MHSGVVRSQRSTRVSKKYWSQQFLPSLEKSRSRKTPNFSLGKVLVLIDLKFCSLEKSLSPGNRKFESQKSLRLDNFHWIVSKITKFRKANSRGELLWFRIKFVAAILKFKSRLVVDIRLVSLNHDAIPYLYLSIVTSLWLLLFCLDLDSDA